MLSALTLDLCQIQYEQFYHRHQPLMNLAQYIVLVQFCGQGEQ